MIYEPHNTDISWCEFGESIIHTTSYENLIINHIKLKKINDLLMRDCKDESETFNECKAIINTIKSIIEG